MAKKTKARLYILDTSVLLEDAGAIKGFGENIVGIPIMVLEELDHIKTEPSFRGRNAREAIRVFDALRTQENLRDGVQLENGGVVKVLVPTKPGAPKQASTKHALGKDDDFFPEALSDRAVDNQILYIAKAAQEKGFDVILVTKDINLRVKADVLGIQAEDFKADLVDERSVYRGWTVVEVSAAQLKKDMPDDLVKRHQDEAFVTNEFIILQSENNPYNVRLFRYLGDDQFKPVDTVDLKWALSPRNIQQRMALDLLLDDSVRLVTLMGPAGTGKTFLALVAGLHEVLLYENYEKMLITRPVIPLGPDIGYLPGDVREKLHTWMQPIYDNMDYILHAAHKEQRALGTYKEEDFDYRRRSRYKKRRMVKEGGLPSLDDLIATHKVSLEAITYMRGRSIPYQYIIIDEVQNLTPHEVKTLISRVGEGSKVILTGDPYQIDAPHLDFSNNGLVVTAERFKGQSIFGMVYLETTERSELSRLAAELL